MVSPQVGEIVNYYPRIDDDRFHNKGHRPVLPGVIVKVWDAVVDLQVLPSLDLNVLQDAQTPITFVPFVKNGSDLGCWSFRG